MSKDLQKAVARIDPIVVEKSFYRQSQFDTPVRVAGNQSPGRFNHEGWIPVQYLSSSVTGVWAEVLRRDELRTEDDAAELRMQIYEVAVECGGIADLSSFELIKKAGLDPASIVSDDQGLCRDLAVELNAASFRGVLAPSAAYQRLGELTLALFGPRVDVDWDAKQPLLRIAIRARPLMSNANPPQGIVSDVRFRGDRHRPLDGFLKGG